MGLILSWAGLEATWQDAFPFHCLFRDGPFYLIFYFYAPRADCALV